MSAVSGFASDRADPPRPTSTTLTRGSRLGPRLRLPKTTRTPSRRLCKLGAPESGCPRDSRIGFQGRHRGQHRIATRHIWHQSHRMVEPNRMATGVDMGPPGFRAGCKSALSSPPGQHAGQHGLAQIDLRFVSDDEITRALRSARGALRRATRSAGFGDPVTTAVVEIAELGAVVSSTWDAAPVRSSGSSHEVST